MFFVSDKQQHKKQKIRDYLNREPMIAVLLAAANFEWTVGRCILFFSESPNVDLRLRLAECYGLDKYKGLWKDEVIAYNPTFQPLARIVKNWKNFKEAFVLRHRLIHARGTCSRKMASEPVEIMLTAVEDLYNFAQSKGKDLHSRLPIRKRKKAVSKI
jgi:hypothetical protein